MNDNVKDWITINHQHIPIKEGQTKNEVVRKFIKQKKSNNKLENDDFSDSKVKDKNGNLMKVYHGTQEDFKEFDEKYIRERPDGIKGFYFTTENRKEGVAGYYAGDTGVVKTAYVNIKNPLYLRTDEYNDKIKEIIKSGEIKKYDGIITINDNDWERDYWDYSSKQLKKEINKKGDIIEIIPFSKNQIKIINSEKRGNK